jgi:hypothetical protein
VGRPTEIGDFTMIFNFGIFDLTTFKTPTDIDQIGHWEFYVNKFFFSNVDPVGLRFERKTILTHPCTTFELENLGEGFESKYIKG